MAVSETSLAARGKSSELWNEKRGRATPIKSRPTPAAKHAARLLKGLKPASATQLLTTHQPLTSSD